MCEYLQQFQHITTVIKHAVASDREGHFPLHLTSVEASLPLFRENDCLNDLLHGSYNLESTRTFESAHPLIFKQLEKGYFVVKENKTSFFNSVAV